MRVFAVPRRRDVVATGEQQPVDAIQRVRHAHGRVHDANLAAGVENRLLVVFELAARRNRNMSHGLHPGRNVDPHQIEGAGELRSEVRDARSAPPAARSVLLVEDRIPMVERVEQLREPERVLREDGEFERADRLLDDLVEPRGFEDERP